MTKNEVEVGIAGPSLTIQSYFHFWLMATILNVGGRTASRNVRSDMLKWGMVDNNAGIAVGIARDHLPFKNYFHLRFCWPSS